MSGAGGMLRRVSATLTSADAGMVIGLQDAWITAMDPVPVTDLKMANIDSPEITPKTNRARHTSVAPTNFSCRVRAKPTTSSGASSFVNANLKLKDEESSSDVKPATAMKGRSLILGITIKHTTT